MSMLFFRRSHASAISFAFWPWWAIVSQGLPHTSPWTCKERYQSLWHFLYFPEFLTVYPPPKWPTCTIKNIFKALLDLPGSCSTLYQADSLSMLLGGWDCDQRKCSFCFLKNPFSRTNICQTPLTTKIPFYQGTLIVTPPIQTLKCTVKRWESGGYRTTDRPDSLNFFYSPSQSHFFYFPWLPVSDCLLTHSY